MNSIEGGCAQYICLNDLPGTGAIEVHLSGRLAFKQVCHSSRERKYSGSIYLILHMS